MSVGAKQEKVRRERQQRHEIEEKQGHKMSYSGV